MVYGLHKEKEELKKERKELKEELEMKKKRMERVYEETSKSILEHQSQVASLLQINALYEKMGREDP